ncbi:DUF4082 domain-containing protein, partial [Microlunatus antarcticus]
MTSSTSPWRTPAPNQVDRPRTPVSEVAARRTTIVLALALLLGLVAALSPWSSTSAEARSTVLGNITPATASFSDGDSVTVGMKFRATATGSVTGVKFYKGSQNTGRHVGALYSSRGQLLARATFTSESGSGWQSVVFDDPVDVRRGGSYTVATFMPEGHYAVTSPYAWPDAGVAVLGLAGTYNYGSDLEFPSSSYGRSNYFVDVIFQASDSTGGSGPTTPAPTTPAPTTPAPTTPAPTTPAPTTPAPTTPSSGFPSEATTGVPAGTALSAYTGPSTITK